MKPIHVQDADAARRGPLDQILTLQTGDATRYRLGGHATVVGNIKTGMGTEAVSYGFRGFAR
jgi:hypothetical protein